MSQADAHYDARETRDPAARERDLFARLPGQIAHTKANAPHFAALFADVDPAAVTSREALAGLPVTRKSELIERQKTRPLFGGLATVESGALARVFCSPGPIYDPQGRRPDYWRFARALFAAGVRAGDLVHNSFSYHLTPAGMMIDSAAEALGCAVFPGGVGNTEQQAQAIADLRPQAYGGTPSFLRILLEKGRELDLDTSSLAKALVSGEALPPGLRAALGGYGVDVLQCYGTADLGLVAYESFARQGMIVDEDVIVEIVTPGTGDPVGDGEVGEVVVTVFAPEYPLIRFATGDLSAVLPSVSPCGRTNMRIKGWLGRADQTTKVKGMFVHPEQIAAVVARHPEVRKARLVVDRAANMDVMTLRCETEGAPEGLVAAVAESLQAVCKLKGRVELVAPGSLPNDGKVIEDLRKLV
ncbi:MAG: phenylacetate--CoA ligase family protein [Alphaproteobacteria bacterium]